MVNGSVKTLNGKKVYLYRANTANASLSSTEYLVPDRYRIGTNNTSPSINAASVDNSIPIDNGTVLSNGTQTMTGSLGGDNTTNNVSVYKEGAGATDNTSQNLIANGTSAIKTWTISALTSNATATSFIGQWLYIKDATALAKFATSGTAIEMRVGSDTSNYYYKQWTASQLSIGWNWLSSITTALNELSVTGVPSGNLDTLVIIIYTNNSSDTFVAGDVCYDLLRQWVEADAKLSFVAGYPSLDMTKLEATTRILLSSTQAAGFNMNAAAIQNRDTSPLTTDIHVFTEESKSLTDEYVLVSVDRVL